MDTEGHYVPCARSSQDTLATPDSNAEGGEDALKLGLGSQDCEL
jgi:hypothetical protein